MAYLARSVSALATSTLTLSVTVISECCRDVFLTHQTTERSMSFVSGSLANVRNACTIRLVSTARSASRDTGVMPYSNRRETAKLAGVVRGFVRAISCSSFTFYRHRSQHHLLERRSL